MLLEEEEGQDHFGVDKYWWFVCSCLSDNLEFARLFLCKRRNAEKNMLC